VSEYLFVRDEIITTHEIYTLIHTSEATGSNIGTDADSDSAVVVVSAAPPVS
jgi:hypothetical protein